MRQRQRMIGNGVVIRLGAAFVFGLLLGFLADKIGSGVQNLLPFLLFPFLIGIIGALITNERQLHPYMMALGYSLAAWVGISAYLLIFVGRGTSTACTAGNCGNASVDTSLLILYLLVGLVPIAVGSLVTSVLARYLRRERSQPR